MFFKNIFQYSVGKFLLGSDLQYMYLQNENTKQKSHLIGQFPLIGGFTQNILPSHWSNFVVLLFCKSDPRQESTLFLLK